MAFDSYIKNGSSTVLPTHFFMTLVKCKNPSDKFPCGEDFDVMSFILPHVDTIPNCLVRVSFLEKQIWFLLTFVLYTFFPFMERIISYSIKNIVCILYPDRGGISCRQCGSSSWHWVVDRTQDVLLIQHLRSGQIIHLPSCELVAVTESKVDWHWMWIHHNRDLQLSVSET